MPTVKIEKLTMFYSSTKPGLIFSSILLLAVSFNVVICHDASAVSKAEVQSCSGCQLNSLPEVKAFIHKDLPNYENVVFKSIYGAPPELVLFTDTYEEVERIPLRSYSREECNNLLKEKGFLLKEDKTEKKEL